MAELKACPFCGGKARAFECLVAFEGVQQYVGCDACKIWYQFGEKGRDAAVAAWNARPAPAVDHSRCGGIGHTSDCMRAPAVDLEAAAADIADELWTRINLGKRVNPEAPSECVNAALAILRRHFGGQS